MAKSTELHRLIVKLQGENSQLKSMYAKTLKMTGKFEQQMALISHRANIQKEKEARKIARDSLKEQKKLALKSTQLEKQAAEKKSQFDKQEKAKRALAAFQLFQIREKIRQADLKAEQRAADQRLKIFAGKIKSSKKRRDREAKDALRDRANRITQHANYFKRLDKARITAAKKTGNTISKIRRGQFKANAKRDPDQVSRIAREARARKFGRSGRTLHSDLREYNREKNLRRPLTLRKKLTNVVDKGTKALQNHGRTAKRVIKEQITLHKRLYFIRERAVANAITNPRAALRSIKSSVKSKVRSGIAGTRSGLSRAKQGISSAATASINAAKKSIELFNKGVAASIPKLLALGRGVAKVGAIFKSLGRQVLLV